MFYLGDCQGQVFTILLLFGEKCVLGVDRLEEAMVHSDKDLLEYFSEKEQMKPKK